MALLSYYYTAYINTNYTSKLLSWMLYILYNLIFLPLMSGLHICTHPFFVTLLMADNLSNQDTSTLHQDNQESTKSNQCPLTQLLI
jgi:hypothetical protein